MGEEKKETEDVTKKSIETGKQAIELNKKVEKQGDGGGKNQQVDETEKKDAEKWRNEG